MKRRMLSFLVALAMLLSFVPVVSAEADQGASASIHTHEGWTELGEGAAFPTEPGKYYLTADQELTNYAVLAAGQWTFCLGGHDIIQTASTYIMYLQADAHVTICDCSAKEESGIYTAGALRHAAGVSTSNNGSAFFVCRGASLTMDDGIITGNTSTNADNGGTVYLQANNATVNGATFTMNGGRISGNTSTRGGAVHVKGSGSTTYTTTPATFTMTGGAIENNLSTVAGAVCATGKGGPVVNITGGKICNNQAGNAASNSYSDTKGNGGALFVRDDAKVTIKNAQISGNTAHNSSGGAIFARDDVALSIENSQITGNTTLQAGAIYIQNRVVMTLMDTVITGNASEKAFAGGIYVTSNANKLTVSGKVVIADNTCSNNDGRENMQMANATSDILYVNGLTEGSDIRYRTADTAETVAANLIAVAQGGKQDSWSAHWVTANGQSISRVDGAFVMGHYHGNVKYEAWTGSDAHNTLPTGSANYYLANDILRNTNGGTVTIGKSVTQRMCLNGHTITHRNPTGRLYAIQGTFILEDCSAYTDSDGNYISGGITYGGATASTRTYGALFNLQSGYAANFVMEEGQIYGLTNAAKNYEAGVAVYIQGASTTKAKAVFTMNGGMIHSINTLGDGAAVHLAVVTSDPDTENPSQFNMNGGKIVNNSTTGTGSQGGRGAIYASHAQVTITGGEITGNAAKAGGAVYVEPTTQLAISGDPTITDNTGGDLYLAGDVVMELGAMTGGKIGISAAKVGRAISTQQTADPTSYFVSNDSEVKLSYKNNCLYLGAVHEHGIDGGAGNLGFTKWTSTDSLPTSSGNYYLENDVQMKASFTLNADVKLCLNGKTVTAANGTRILSVGKGGTLTITDCCDTCGKLTGGNNNYGAALNVNRMGTLKLYKGTITGNTSGVEGGGVYLQGSTATEPGGVFYMYGGTITGNTAKMGAGVSLAASADPETAAAFHFYGGEISGNTATNGGGVFSYGGNTVTLAGGKIVNNTATGAGGGVYVHRDMGTVQLSGAPVVKDNKSGSQSNNLHLMGDRTLTVAELTQGAMLFVTAETCDRAITNEVDQAELDYFHSDSVYRMLVYKENKVFLEISDEHTHCTCFHLTQGCDHKEIKWQAWESTTSLPTSSGNYYLLSDVNVAEGATIPENQNVRLCLNGKTVTGTRLLLIRKDSTLSITDCAGTGTITGGDRNYGGAINVNRMATLNLYGGTITGNTAGKTTSAASLGGGVYLQAGKTDEPGAIFHMYGGTISENSGYQGGGIHVAAGEMAGAIPAQLNIYGGTISGNTAGGKVTNANGTQSTKGGSGAAIYVGKYGIITMTGGTVTGNNGLGYGGTIYLNGAIGKFSGGTVTGNISAKDGGGLYAVSASWVEITGDVVFSNNKSTSGAGGGIGFSGKSQVVMSSGTVSDNYAPQGGGVIVQSGAAMELTGGTIKNNESKVYGGAIYVSVPNSDGTASCLKMSGGTVTGNSSGNAGGGIYANKAQVEITGGTVSYNTTKNYGCGVYLHTCTGALTGGQILGNTSGKDGAGAYFFAGKVQLGGSLLVSGNVSEKGAGGGVGFTKECQAVMHGGTITGNKAPHGGGIIVQGKAHLAMTGGSVENNTATKNCGGVYVNASSADFQGNAKIRNNSTDRYGGGIYSNNSTVTITGITVSGNTAKAGSGGMHAIRGQVTVKDAVFAENSTDVAGGGICATRGELLVENTVFEKNTANNGGGVLVQNYAKATLNDVIIRENTACEAAGMQVYSNVEVTVNGGAITGNQAITKLNKNGQTVGGRGAGILLNSGRITYSGRSDLYLNGVTIQDNTAAADGAGIYVDMQMVAYLDGCTVQNNTAGGRGAGIYQASGTKLFVKNSKLLANTAGATGSAIYAGSDFTLESSTITGNKTTDGAAVYVAPARYDGHSYMNAMIKLGGDLQLCDNEGTMQDLYLDEGVAAAVTAEGFGKNTKIGVGLHSGVLTNSILGVYDYEGGNLVYTITYGDRSLTDPEYVAVAQEQAEEKTREQSDNAWLYVAVGVFALAVIGVVVLLLTKKKKSAAGLQK